MQGPSSYNVLNYYNLPILRDLKKKIFFLVFKVYPGQLLQKVFRINRYAHKKHYFYPDKRAFLCLREDAKPSNCFLMTIYIKRFKKIRKK